MARIRGIGQAELDNFGLDENDQLYWHGRKVRTALPKAISWLAWILTGATVISAVVQVIELFLHWVA
jgi:hypothetical protein